MTRAGALGIAPHPGPLEDATLAKVLNLREGEGRGCAPLSLVGRGNTPLLPPFGGPVLSPSTDPSLRPWLRLRTGLPKEGVSGGRLGALGQAPCSLEAYEVTDPNVTLSSCSPAAPRRWLKPPTDTASAFLQFNELSVAKICGKHLILPQVEKK